MSILFLMTRRGRVTRRLQRLTPDQLCRETIRLEQILQQMQQELADRENQKADLFDRGRRTDSAALRIGFARGMQRHEAAIGHLRQRLELVHRHLQVLDGLRSVLATRGMIDRVGFGSVLAQLSSDDLRLLLEDAAVSTSVEADRLERLARLLDGAADPADPSTAATAGDAGLSEVVRAMERARTAAVVNDEPAVPLPADGSTTGEAL
jgi:hypothetical protein